MEALCNHKWCVSLFLLDGKRKDDEVREVERRETTEESILEKFLPTQNSTGNQLKKKKKKEERGPLFFPFHATLIPTLQAKGPFCQRDRSHLLMYGKYCLLQTFQLTHVKKAL